MSHSHPLHDFRAASSHAAQDPTQRHNTRAAMDFLMQRRAAQFPDADELSRLRDLGQRIRQRALSRLPLLLEQLEARCVANGIQVHWADTPAEACEIVAGLMRQANSQEIIKGKSMVSEEIELNHFLEAQGMTALESDMGEFIVQLAHEKPSHIIMPAIHKTKVDIAHLFHDELPRTPYTEDVDELIQIGRQALRQRFFAAKVGLSGVNVAVAETGTLVLVENEGNGRLTTSAPEMHIAITGIEKVVEKLEDVPPILSLLTRSATGQPITTYVNMISSPRKAGEKDGPQQVHLVLLDNGRSQAYADLQLRETLQCIRCGACMNHCPVYTRIGGHAYGTTYPGPIGKIISPHLLGLDDTKDLPSASTLCGACSEVCPVRIPIPELLLRLRHESVTPKDEPNHPHTVRGQGAKYRATEKWLWRSWARIYSQPVLYRASRFAATRLRGLLPHDVGAWTIARAKPQPAAKSLHELVAEYEAKRGQGNE